ncbi:hypothetical protein TWF970_004428 [Orbilia oligospora]|uniref:Protein kinase domain-containing protein n=1 Tax=Orbilia oligospora TaxID=2813651 RepID=A0A7C8VF27_ORBOL|nr:hypothetical protein TWF970_004428 [Orbilia oligospora]
MDLFSFLEAVAPPKIRKTSPISSTPPTNPVSPGHHLQNLKEWPDIRNKVHQLLDPLLQQKRWSSCGNKSDVLRLGAHVYERPSVRILYELFSIDSDFGHHKGAIVIGDPDRVFYTYTYTYTGKSYERSRTKFLIQWEPPWTFSTPQNLIHHFNDNRADLDDKVVKLVHQIYGYMTFNNLTYGGFCNYEALYLFRRTRDNGLEVSPPFLYSDPGTRGPVAALMYICKQAVEEHQSFNSFPITHTFILDDLDIEGTWDENLTVPWKDMALRLSGTGRKNIATVMSGEIQPREDVKFRYSSPAFFKVYDITKPYNLDFAHKEISAYNRLHSLQGKYIPRLYAAGSTWKALKILVIEDCGQTACDENMTEELWSQARNAIVAIHRHGAIHGDIRIENFVIAKGTIKVIDLGMCRQGTPSEQDAELAELDKMRKSWEAERTSDLQ